MRGLGLVCLVVVGGCGDDASTAVSSTATSSSGSPAADTGTDDGDGTSGTSGDPAGTSTEGETTAGADSTGGTDTGGPTTVPLEGYGTLSTFGEGGDVCVVTNLDASGPGSLFDCVTERDTTDDNPTPRRVEFAVGGTIVQTQHVPIRQPFLTIDGLTAPKPGITITKEGDGTDGALLITTWSPNATCGHDVLVQGLRFVGVWTGRSEAHDQSAGTIGIDGEDVTLCMRNVVLNRITVLDAQDTAGDIWGSAVDITVQYSAFLNSLHPNTYSHQPGGEPDQQRERISNHHNLYAYIHERGPQVRGDIRDSNFEQNIMHRWAAYGFLGGYAMRLRCRDGACPQRLNVIANHFTDGSAVPEAAVVVGEDPGDEPDELQIDPQVFMADNRLPPENVDSTSAAAEFDRSPEAVVTIVEPEAIVSDVLPNIGTHFRTAQEDALFDEVGVQVQADLD